MDDSDLKHNVTYTHYIQIGKDDYGQPQYNSSSYTEKCFFDLPRKQKVIRIERSEIEVEATLYMKKDSAISIDDVVNIVTDVNGITLSSVKLRVARITRASDFGQIHHLEVDLRKG